MCCGPCAVYPVECLQDKYDLKGLFFNPNIHPYTEYKKRMETALDFSDRVGLDTIVIDEYNLDDFLRNAAFRENQRCIACYSTRLDRAASVAKRGKFDVFTTTLLVSPYQKHELIKKIGEEAAQKYGIDFLYLDFRLGYKEGVEKSKQLELYRQQYCGCIYSERDRYLRKKQK